MIRARLVVLAVLALTLASCTGVPGKASLDQGRVPPDRPNGQPGWWPCMLGDHLCRQP